MKALHLQFQSTGGFIGDGVFLYNFFRALTLDLTIYNSGSVASIAAIAFLGAKHRKVSKYATFMIHRSHNSPQQATAKKLEDIARSLRIDDERTEAILRSHIKLTDDEWKAFDYEDLTFGAEEAVKKGFADAIGDFEPPAGSPIFTL